MRRYLGIGAAWLGATVLSVLIASAAVAGIRDRVVETPVAIGPPTSTTVVGETSSTQAPATTATSTTTTVAPTTTTAPVAETTSTTTTVPTDPPTTAAPPATTTTTTPTTTTPTTTTTTVPPTTTTAGVSYSTHDLIGGTVVLAFGNGQVNLVSATPRTGFSVDAEHTGPTEVEVKFESNEHKSKLEAKIENGELRVETEEESHGDDDN